MNIWIDDKRDPALFSPSLSWVWIKDGLKAGKYIQDHRNEIERISFDHDLGFTYDENGNAYEISGYDVICMIEENDIRPSIGMYCHSQNPVGKRRIQQVIDKIMRV